MKFCGKDVYENCGYRNATREVNDEGREINIICFFLGRELMALYRDAGIPTDRVLLKIASTWEGAEAARQVRRSK